MHIYTPEERNRIVPPKTLQRLRGHEDFSTTMNIYLRFTDDDLEGVEELLAESGQ